LLIDGRWADEHNRKQFFDSFARENGFDPLVPENWYLVTLDKLQQQHKVFTFMYLFSMNNSLLKSLIFTPKGVGNVHFDCSFYVIPNRRCYFQGTFSRRCLFFVARKREHGGIAN
jgi:hypothetical protein